MKQKIKTGCLFGSFNPIHTGHLMVAEYMVDRTDLDEIRLIVSPHNPLKDQSGLAPEAHRLAMVELAIADNPRLMASDIEFSLPKPSYTVATLDELAKRQPEREFVLIIGGDNLALFKKWRDWDRILMTYGCYTYARSGAIASSDLINHSGVKFFDAPLINVSATYIRESLRQGYSTKYLLPDQVRGYIEKHKVFRFQGE